MEFAVDVVAPSVCFVFAVRLSAVPFSRYSPSTLFAFSIVTPRLPDFLGPIDPAVGLSRLINLERNGAIQLLQRATESDLSRRWPRPLDTGRLCACIFFRCSAISSGLRGTINIVPFRTVPLVPPSDSGSKIQCVWISSRPTVSGRARNDEAL